MTDKEMRQKYLDIYMKIVDDTITKEDAISEYMELGDSRESAELIYREVKSEAYKAEHNLL
ncbi:MAG: hypothetical protein FWH53_00790 [Leptospirales bacterium]|nr:hypothetical protein [Leptospirales bacterium]